MSIRNIRGRAAVVAAIAGLAASVGLSGPANAAPADDTTLLDTAEQYLAGENAVTVRGSSPAEAAVDKAESTDVTKTFSAERDDRMTARAQLRQVNDAAGVRYSAVRTKLTPAGSVAVREDTARLSVWESTEYTFADGGDPYSYRVRQDLDFARTGDGWALSGITAHDGPADLATPHKLGSKELADAKKAAAKLRADSSGKDERLLDAAKKPQEVSGQQSAAPRAAYDYTAMLDFATEHAKPDPEDDVPYERDTNDCTNFISHTLAAGGWGEEWGWYRSDSAWWYNFNGWPFPDNHSYTWGGAPNWQRFARDESERVSVLDGPSSLAITDVVQFEIFDYSDPGEPGHTMMVTDFTADWTAKMSYHSSDTLNRPLSEILAEHNQGEKFWYFRT